MNYSVNLSPEAEGELTETALYVQEYNPNKAQPFIQALLSYYIETLLHSLSQANTIILK